MIAGSNYRPLLDLGEGLGGRGIDTPEGRRLVVWKTLLDGCEEYLVETFSSERDEQECIQTLVDAVEAKALAHNHDGTGVQNKERKAD